jgi:hypothetical protein
VQAGATPAADDVHSRAAAESEMGPTQDYGALGVESFVRSGQEGEMPMVEAEIGALVGRVRKLE